MSEGEALPPFAHHVASLVPVFVAPAGGQEFLRPHGWQSVDVAANAGQLARWRPGSAVCAVLGNVLAVIDVDPRNGGEADAVRELLARLDVRVYAEVGTPGDGMHFYVAGHPDLPTCHDLKGFPGVDVQSHRANVFLPGTARPKYDGRGYTVLRDELEALGDDLHAPGGKRLAEWVREMAPRSRYVPPLTAASTPARKAPDEREIAYLKVAVKRTRDELAQAPLGNRNHATYVAALKLGSLVVGAGLDESEVISALVTAAGVNGLLADDGATSVIKTIESGLRDGKRNPRGVPVPHVDASEEDGNTSRADHASTDDSGADGARPREDERPVPLDQAAPLPVFPADALPDAARAMVLAVAEFTQTDTALAGTVALGVLSACAAGRASVEVLEGWTEPLNLYAVVASAPGTRKSPVFAQMTAPLVEAERAMVEEWRPKALQAQTLRQVAEEAARLAQLDAAKHSDDARRQADAVSASALVEQIKVPPQPRILADDVTPEVVPSLLAAHGGKLAVMSPEGGVFDTLAGRYSNGVPNLDTFLKGWSAEPVTVDRRGKPSDHVPHANISMMLTIQPAVLNTIAANGTFRGRGLLARFLFALPPNNVGRRRVGTAPVDRDTSDSYGMRVRTLALEMERWVGDPARLVLMTDAADLLFGFAEAIEPRLSSEGDLGAIADWGSKVVGQAVRVAGLLHLADGPSAVRAPIQASTMRNALRLIDYYVEHAKAAFVGIAADAPIADAKYVLDHLRRERIEEFSISRLHTKLGTTRFPRVDALKAAIEVLEEHRWIVPLPGEQLHRSGRKPSPRYRVRTINE